jgi:hypothetical protein
MDDRETDGRITIEGRDPSMKKAGKKIVSKLLIFTP